MPVREKNWEEIGGDGGLGTEVYMHNLVKNIYY